MLMLTRSSTLRVAFEILEDTLWEEKKPEFSNIFAVFKTKFDHLQHLAEQAEKDSQKCTDFEQTFLSVERELQGLKNDLYKLERFGPHICNVLYDFKLKLLKAVDEDQQDSLSNLLVSGRILFEERTLQNYDAYKPYIRAVYCAVLCKAVKNGRLVMAGLLLENGAPACMVYHRPFFADHENMGEPLSIAAALDKDAASFVRLLLDHNAPVDFSRPAHDVMRLFNPTIARGDIDMVTVLLRAGLKSVRLEQFARSNLFRLLLEEAAKDKQSTIFNVLLNEFKVDQELLTLALPILIKNAPLAGLKNYIDDPDIPPQKKLATVTYLGDSHAELLIQSLLTSAYDPEERMAVLKLIIKMCLDLDHLTPSVTREPCYGEKDCLQALAETAAEGPIKYLAGELSHSIKRDSQQGRVMVGFRMLVKLRHTIFSTREAFEFSAGMCFLDSLCRQLYAVYQGNESMPDAKMIAKFLIKAERDAAHHHTESTPKADFPAVKHESPELYSIIAKQEDPRRFRAMVGGAIFAELNPSLISGGMTQEAVRWYGDALPILSETMGQFGMLDETWGEGTALRLLEDISGRSSSKFRYITSDQIGKAIGFELIFPEHAIASCLYKCQGEWHYTVMCRMFLDEGGGAADFVVPDDRIDALLDVVRKQNTPGASERGFNQSRTIMYGLLIHLRDIELATGAVCTYSQLIKQKPYKNPDCFASNIKPLLPILLSIMVKPTVTAEQWQQFNNKLKSDIVSEMAKADISLADFDKNLKAIPKKEAEPLQIAYKLFTALIRWREINQFNPSNTAEAIGKVDTEKHVLRLTGNRFRLFNSKLPEDDSENKTTGHKPSCRLL